MTGGDKRLEQGDQLRGFLSNLDKGCVGCVCLTGSRAGKEEEVSKGYLGSDSNITIPTSVLPTYWMWEENGEWLSMTSRLCKFCCLMFFKQLCINMTFWIEKNAKSGCSIKWSIWGTLESWHKVGFPKCHLWTPALSASLPLTILTFFFFLVLLLKYHTLFSPSFLFLFSLSHPSQEKKKSSIWNFRVLRTGIQLLPFVLCLWG